jgi:hypothetical protein
MNLFVFLHHRRLEEPLQTNFAGKHLLIAVYLQMDFQLGQLCVRLIADAALKEILACVQLFVAVEMAPAVEGATAGGAFVWPFVGVDANVFLQLAGE